MFNRILTLPLQNSHSVFLFGPPGTGKTSWLKAHLPSALYIDLTDETTYRTLSKNPGLLESLTAGISAWVIIEEIQLIPELLNMVHYLIEGKRTTFIMTCSSMQNLRKPGVNLLAGRALLYYMHPLIVQELGGTFELQNILDYGLLPEARQNQSHRFLQNYIKTNAGEFLNSTDSFGVLLEKLEDALLNVQLFPFTQRSKRRMKCYHKFYCSDVGIFQILAQEYAFPAGMRSNMALATLFLQALSAINDYYDLDYRIYFWHLKTGPTVDFVILGKRGFHAFSITSQKVVSKSLKSLRKFEEDYPEAQLHILHTGALTEYHGKITATPLVEMLKKLPEVIG